MQGTPAHLETLKSDGKRRHPSKCRYAEGKPKDRYCKNPNFVLYLQQCRSSAKCDYYEEK